MKRGTAFVILLISIVLITVGLIFLCAATQQPDRYLLAFVLLASGVGLAIWSGMVLRRWRTLDPENLSDAITSMARRGGHDEVTLSQVVGGLGVPDEAAQSALDLLVSRGQCRRERRYDTAVYVFPGLKESKVVRRCTHCGSEFNVREALHECPNCGGEVELIRE
jgi:hypothetical protein